MIDTSAEPGNILNLWNRLHTLDDQITAANTTAQQHADLIAALQATQGQHATQIQQALITAGKATSASTQGNAGGPAGGGGDTGGGSGGGPTGDVHPNHFAEVAQAKSDLITEGVDITGPCGAFQIVRRACQYIGASEPSVGVLQKPSPTVNNCILAGTGYAADIICYNDGLIYDVLNNGGGSNDVQWNFAGTVDPSRYRPAP